MATAKGSHEALKAAVPTIRMAEGMYTPVMYCGASRPEGLAVCLVDMMVWSVSIASSGISSVQMSQPCRYEIVKRKQFDDRSAASVMAHMARFHDSPEIQPA